MANIVNRLCGFRKAVIIFSKYEISFRDIAYKTKRYF